MSAIITNLLPAIIGLLGVLIGFLFGKSWERKKLEIALINETLHPIMDWLKCVEKVSQIFADDYDFFVKGQRQTSTYTLDDRRKSNQYIKENKNEVMGIINSQILQKRNIRKYAIQLGEQVNKIENVLNAKLLSLGFDTSTIVNSDKTRMDFMDKYAPARNELDNLLQNAYSIINKMKDNSI